MTDAALVIDLAQPSHHVMRSAAWWFVDHNESVMHGAVVFQVVRALVERSERGPNARDHRRDVQCRLETGRDAMAPTPVRGGDCSNIDIAQRTEAHPYAAVEVLLEHAGDLSLRRTPDDVDQALDLLQGDAVTSKHVLGDGSPHEPPLDVELGRRQRFSEELQVCESMLLEQLAGETRDRYLELDQFPRQVENAGRGGVVLEAAGVAHQRRVQSDGGVVGEPQSQLEQETPDEH